MDAPIPTTMALIRKPHDDLIKVRPLPDSITAINPRKLISPRGRKVSQLSEQVDNLLDTFTHTRPLESKADELIYEDPP